MRSLRKAIVGALLVGVGLPLFGLHPVAGASGSFSADAPSPPAELQWSACPDVPNTECASIEVPVDHARPDGAQLTLRLGRVPAADPAHSRGVLLFIPGGPGVGISGALGDFRALHHIDELARQWDVVSFDPRGIGESSPIRCSPDAVPPVIAPFDRPPSPAEFEAVAHANATFIQSCVEATGELVAHLSSMDNAADIERIRQALSPNDGLVAYGGSYGSPYAAAYLERYGEHVKALVLDGVVDHSVDLPTFIARNVLAVNEAFDRFAKWCEQDSACALHGRDLGSVFDAAIATAPAVRTVVPQRMAAGRQPQSGWPMIAQMLAQVSDGDTSALEALTGAGASASTVGDPWIRAGTDGLYYGVLCADFGPQRDYAAFAAAADAIARRAPRFAWRFWDATSDVHGTAGVGDCVGWPYEARNPPHRLQVGSHPNVLVANPAYDPQTPLINALAVWLQIPEARLLIADVDGHQSLVFSRCAFEAQMRFLADPTTMPSTTLCGSSASTSEVASGSTLPRNAVLALSEVKQVLPEMSQETATGEDETALANPRGTRSVTYATDDGSRRVVVSVAQYRSSQDASSAYRAAVQGSLAAPGGAGEALSNLGEQAFIGVSAQGDETHVGGGALYGDLIVSVTLQGYDGTTEDRAAVIALIRTEAVAATRAL